MLSTASNQPDPLPSWYNGAAKNSILAFVNRVTSEDGPDFVPSAERIATFDNDGLRFGLLVHHTDADREWVYDRESNIGKLDRALDEAASNGWTVVSMKDDWKVIYPEKVPIGTE